MAANLIATTPRVSMHALAFKGIRVTECFAQIRDMLMRRFGDEYVLLFAKPEENKADGNIDWYSPVQGSAQPLNTLPENEREPIWQVIRHMAAEISRYAEELINSNEPLKVTRGNILKLALRYPDDSAVYAVGKQPVFTCWGFGPGTPGVEPKDLSKSVPQPRQPRPVKVAQISEQEPPLPGESNSRRSLGLWWLLLPLLPLLLLLALLFGAFGPLAPLSGITLFHFPALPFMKDYTDNSSQLANLEAQIPLLLKKLETHSALCKPLPPASVTTTEKPLKAESPPKQLVIPEKARDVAFMEGSWICETGLASKRTGEPVQFSFSFDNSGKGKGVVMEKNDRCTGNARAEMRNGILHIDLGRQKCGNTANSYDSVSIECKNTLQTTAQCRGINADGSTWTGIFLRY